MAKVKSTKIGNSLVHKDVLYGPMLSAKYGKDFLDGVEMAKASGAKQIWGEGEITGDNKPQNFVGDPSEGVFMWPHVFVDVTEDMECFHEEIFGPLVTVVKLTTLITLYTWQMLARMGYLQQFTPMTASKHIGIKPESKLG